MRDLTELQAGRRLTNSLTLQDSYSGADFAKKEIQDEYGVVTGEYRVALPDGRIQIVTYRADHEAVSLSWENILNDLLSCITAGKLKILQYKRCKTGGGKATILKIIQNKAKL